MAVGEFGGAAAATGGHGPMYAAPAYWLYEMSQAALNPARAFADAGRLFFKNPANPWAHTEIGKTVAAAIALPYGVWDSGLAGFRKNRRVASDSARAGSSAAWLIS